MCEVAKEEQLNHGKTRVEAITEAAKVRLRPILMTTAADDCRSCTVALCNRCRCGISFQYWYRYRGWFAIGTLFTLFVLPVIYSYIASEHKPLPVFDENVNQLKVTLTNNIN